VEDMIARLTSKMTTLHARFSNSSSGAECYNSLFLSLPSPVIKPVNVLRGLATKTSVDKTWIVDSGASQHITPYSTVFKSYKPLSGKEKVQIADGTFCSIVGIGSVVCTPNIQLSFVLHVSNFTNNLMSVSQLVDDLNCIVSLSPSHVVVQELETGKVIGIGKRNEDLYRLEQGPEFLDAKAYFAGNPEMEMILWHRRLGHMSFSALEKIFPVLFKKYSRSELVYDACEFAKHIRTMYPSLGNRSLNYFDVIFSDVWGSSRIASSSGFRWFVTFIDCCSRVTWLFLMHSKSEVPKCF
jgi:GAG-pre-integrase domain